MKIYKIEKGIKLTKPLPAGHDGKPSKVALTLNEMKKGDSFLIDSELEGLKAEKVIRDRNTREARKGSGIKFTSRRTEKGVRVWRER